jgi:16S rRNA (adenine1518-N6/adenine1519-N6)-dimethyltransferase
MQPRHKGIVLKKKFGQHFLKDARFLGVMLDAVSLDATTSVFEIGGGAGALTRVLLEQQLARLWVFEIDPDWAQQLSENKDERLTVYTQDILMADFEMFKEHAPWTLVANLPYQITFPLFYRLQLYRHLLKEAVVMVQEEVAQKIMKTHGRDYGAHSLFLQYYFEWRMLDKVPPDAFYPPPRVFSRLLYFKPHKQVAAIRDEEQFWPFVRRCFKQPRRTLRNNLAQTEYDISVFDDKVLSMRAQQLAIADFLQLWQLLDTTKK